VISRIPNLKVLDFERVTHKERQQALSKFNFAPEKLRLEEEEAKIAKDKKEKIKVHLTSLFLRICIYFTIFLFETSNSSKMHLQQKKSTA